MTVERAMEILDPEKKHEELTLEEVNEACKVAIQCMSKWENHRKAMIASGKKRYQRCKASGICVNCGSRAALPKNLLCEVCKSKQDAWRDARKQA